MFLTAAPTLLIQVLVKSLFDRGFLFLLSSTQMVESKGTEKLFTLLSSFSVVSVELLLVPLGEFSLFFKKKVLFVLQSGGGGWKRTCKHYSSFRSQGWLSSTVSVIHSISISFPDQFQLYDALRNLHDVLKN